MKNYWTCMGDVVAQWRADLSALWPQPELLLEWARQVTAAGDQLEVIRVLESETLGYRRDRDGSPLPLLEELFDRSRTVDLFYFTAPPVPVRGVFPRSRLAGRLAYFDQEGKIQEEEVQQVGRLLVRCRPDILKRGGAWETGGAVVSYEPPLRASGPQLCFSDLKRSQGIFTPKSVHVYFTTSTDIWQPWVTGWVELHRDIDSRFDNRPLAERHTPRLNAFIRRVRELTLEMGGAWYYQPDDSKFDWTRLYGEFGVCMDDNESRPTPPAG
jgi:hypothetical protein